MKTVIFALSLIVLLSGCETIGGKNNPQNMEKQQVKSPKNLIYHVNPMPNFMQVVMKYGDQLELTGEQQKQLSQWRDYNQPVMAEAKKKIVADEVELRHMALNNATESDLLAQLKQIENQRTQIATTKIKCRSMMQSVLSEQQFLRLQQIYNDNLLTKHL